MSVPGLATAADYSEAISVARRAKSILALLLLLTLVTQLTLFFLVRYDILKIPTATAPATQPSDQRLGDLLHYVSGVTVLGGIAVGLGLSLVLMLIAHIMLVGRLIGVGKVTSSLIWSFILLIFLFPWQSFMNHAELTVTNFIPTGVLWTWAELAQRAHFPDEFSDGQWASTILSWFRFAGAPLIAIIITLVIQLKSNRGVKMAMGEDEVLNEVMRQSM